jgi:hypothetical protein
LREVARVGSTTQIAPPDDGAVVTIVYADGMRADREVIAALRGDATGLDEPFGENEYSIVLHVQYNEFQYVTGMKFCE